MFIRFYTDENIPRAVATQLQAKGVDIICCQDVMELGVSDAIHLEFAANEGRTIITADEDFFLRHEEWLAQGNHHAGIIYVQPADQGNIGKMVSHLFFLHEAVQGGATDLVNEIHDRIDFL